jgi:nitrite reductase (NADH) small subunit
MTEVAGRPAADVATPARELHRLGVVDEMPLNAITTVSLKGRDLGVIRTSAAVYAIGNRCPHQGGPMCFGEVGGTMLPSDVDEYVYGRDGLVVKCPWHAYEFHVENGESVGGVLEGRVPTFEVVVEDGVAYTTLRRLTGRTLS